jgi:hypothetical protein
VAEISLDAGRVGSGWKLRWTGRTWMFRPGARDGSYYMSDGGIERFFQSRAVDRG